MALLVLHIYIVPFRYNMIFIVHRPLGLSHQEGLVYMGLQNLKNITVFVYIIKPFFLEAPLSHTYATAA